MEILNWIDSLTQNQAIVLAAAMIVLAIMFHD